MNKINIEKVSCSDCAKVDVCAKIPEKSKLFKEIQELADKSQTEMKISLKCPYFMRDPNLRRR